jgi:D-xylose transport system substrate-binding protein
MLALTVVGLLVTGSMTACTDDSGTTADGGAVLSAGGPGKIGVILPDTKTSARWKNDDPKYLAQAFKAAGITADIQNAEGDKAKFVQIGTQMISEGARVLVIANLDSPSGKAVIDKAHKAKVKVVDYDRLTLDGGADFYVSFDNVKVGELQGQGLVKCLSERNAVNPVVAEVNGSPTDNNATLFKQGYDSVLQPLYDKAQYTKGPDQSVPDWDNDAGGALFKQMWEQQPRITGVLAANDGLGGAVISLLREAKRNGQIPVTGQDATVQGLQNILVGDQCMTVYKAIKPEAQAAATLAISLFNGSPITAEALKLPSGGQFTKIKDPETGAYVQFVSLTPVAIDKSNVQAVINDGFASKKEVCAGKFAAACDANGIK